MDWRHLASQLGFLCLPFLYLLLAWWFGAGSPPLGLLFPTQLLLLFVLYKAFQSYAKRRIFAAEFFTLRLAELVEIEGTVVPTFRSVCLHCGYQEYVWDYASMQISAQAQGRQVGLAFSTFGAMFPVVRYTLIDALRALGATGLDLAPVGGSEPAEWYVLRSSHILPPMQSPPTRLTELPYRTQKCTGDHGLENVSDIPYTDFYYRRSSLSALDINYTYELFGHRMRRGSRSLVISQRVFRLLAKLEREFPWYCNPIQFVD